MQKLDKKLIKWFIGKNVFVDERIQKEVGIFATKTVFILFVFELVFGCGISVGFWILHSLFSFKEIISALIFTIFFTFFMTSYERRHVKTVKDDE